MLLFDLLGSNLGKPHSEGLIDWTQSSLSEKSLIRSAAVENIIHNNLTSQLHEAIISIGTNKRVAKTLKRKIWVMRHTLGALKSSDILLGI